MKYLRTQITMWWFVNREVSYQMQLVQAPHICCTSFLEPLHVAEQESTMCKVARSRLWLRKVFPNSCGHNQTNEPGQFISSTPNLSDNGILQLLLAAW